MREKKDYPRRWLKLLPVILLCLILGSGKLSAKARHFNNTEDHFVVNNPTLTAPYMSFQVMYYDRTSSNNSFFQKRRPSGVPSNAPEGPAVFIDGVYFCSPVAEMAFPGGSSATSGDGDDGAASDLASKDNSWSGKVYRGKINGKNYTLLFYDPRQKGGGSQVFMYTCYLFVDKMQVGDKHSVTIKGWWRMNSDQRNGKEESWTWNFNALGSFGFGSPSATMYGFDKMKISGKISSSCGPTVVGTYNGATKSGLSWTDGLTTSQSFIMGTPSFTDAVIGCDDRTDYTGTHTKYVEYIIQYPKFSKPSGCNEIPNDRKPDISLYQWYVTSVPGYVKPVQASTPFESFMWAKSIKINWGVDESGTRNKNGKWYVYRNNQLITPNGLSYSTRNYTDNEVPEYDVNYTYKVSFIPDGANAENDNDKLAITIKNAIVERNWGFSNIACTLVDDGAHIKLTWNNNVINDASGTHPYTLSIYRSDNDGKTWGSPIKTININSSSTAKGEYVDEDNQLHSNYTYNYMLSINLLEKDFTAISAPITLGGSQLTGFRATRGDYNNVVKLSWNVKQVGGDDANFVISRRPLGTKGEDEGWVNIHTTSGTASSYSYEDITALPGTYNEYRVSITGVDGSGNNRTFSSKTTDGFSYSTGVISGRVKYGTGTAVEGVKVKLMKQDNEGDMGRASMHSLRLRDGDAAMVYDTTPTEIQQLFGDDFSVQMFVKPMKDEINQNGADYLAFDVYCVFTIRLYYHQDKKAYQLSAFVDGDEKSNVYIPADEWSQLTFVHSHKDSVTYVWAATNDTVMSDTILTGKVVNWNSNALKAKKIAVGNAGGDDIANNFKGFIDEFRLFTKALTEKEILRNYNHPLVGTEDGLAIYYPFDEGLTTQTIAYDYSKTNGIPNGRHALSEVAAYSSTDVPSENLLCMMAYTDVNGNYTIRGVHFSDDGTAYSVIPELGIHQFSPTSQSRFVSQSSLVHSAVDFDDQSSFPVSGTVYYENTTYPVEGVTFRVDGVTCTKDGDVIQTNENGEYTISVPIGDHFITAEKNGHTFVLNGRYPEDRNNVGTKHTFNKEIKNLEFYDNTLVNFTGRVVGGSIEGNKKMGFALSKNNIGIAQLQITPLNTNFSLNSVKAYNNDSTAYWYDVNDAKREAASASKAINSNSWYGAQKTFCNTIYVNTDSMTSEFSVMLPPLEYSINSITVLKTGQKLLDAGVTIDLTNTTKELSDTLYNEDGSYELYKYNVLYKKVYHSDATFTVQQDGADEGAFGIKTYEFEDDLGKININDIYTVNNGVVTYRFDYPIFIKEDNYTFLLEGFEEYTNSDNPLEILHDKVPLKENIITISNALSADQSVYVEDYDRDGINVKAGQLVELKNNQLMLDSLGRATYKWKAGLPNIAKPFTRTISIYYDIEGTSKDWSGNGMEGVILGSLSTGNNFITAGPDKLLMILRDPPGTNSSAEWSTGSVTTKSTVRGNTFTENAQVSAKHRFGLHTEIIAGTPGVGDITVLESKDDLEIGAKMESEGESSTTMETTTTITQAFSTSGDPEYVGAMGDVFIGQSTNIVFGKARDVRFKRGVNDELSLDLEDIMTTGLRFGTLFSYTLNYIENVLFPNYNLMMRNLLTTVDQNRYNNTTESEEPIYLTTLEPDDENYGRPGTYKFIAPDNGVPYNDSLIWINTQIDNWTKYLARNEQEKVEAFNNRTDKTRNYSFDSGSDVSYSIEIDSTKTSSWDWKVAAGVILNNSFGVEVKGFGIEISMEDETTGGRHETDETTHGTSSSFSFTLSEEGDDDAISVDVYEYGSYSPIFRTRGGQTCNPYEGEFVTKYYKPGTTIMEATMQIEVPHIQVTKDVISDIPSGGTANYTLQLSNASEIDEDVYYRLLVNDESNPNGANLTIDGRPVTDSRIIKIPAGQTITKALQLKQTNLSILEYKDIEIVLASQTQFDPTSTWDVIADTVKITAQFVPSSSDVTISLDNTLINSTTGTDLNVSFKDFDRNYLGLKAFRLQYKKQGSALWTQFKEYVVDKKDNTDSNEMLPDGGTVTYKLPMSSFTDGEYTFRVLSVSTYAGKEITKSSQEIVLIKDMQRPRPLGQPEPADGILNIGDDLSITFNEKFMNGELTKTGNFIVTGVLNGATIDHETALRMSGAQTTAETESDINLVGKEFSMDMWVKIDGAGTILSHGNGAAKMSIAITSDDKLQVNIADSTFRSNATIAKGKWVFLTLGYRKENGKYLLNASVADDSGVTDLLTNKKAPEYLGNGPISVGKNMNGAIHELLLWDAARDMTVALMDRSKTKNPSTRHLAGYWKMNEGEGTKITDFARAHHMIMEDESWYLNNENLAIQLDGTKGLMLYMAESPHSTGDDYMIEFWMRTSQNAAKAQLIQAGKVGLWLENGLLKLTSDDSSFDAGSALLNDNTWHHVALNVLRIGSAAVYVDGNRVMTTSAQNIASIVTDNIIVGATRTYNNGSYSFSNFYVGQIDEVRVWNATLDASQISTKRKLRLTGTEEGLVAYYPFEAKGLDSGNQIITIGSDADLTKTSRKAQLTADGQINYVSESPALRNKPIETNVSYEYTASDNKIVIDINEEPAIIEGCYINLTVRDLRDVNGNYSEAVTWTVFVNRNELAWKEDNLNVTTHVKDEATFTATIINKSGTQQLWTLSGLPSWLEASADYGTINPTAQTQITFTVSEATPIGRYHETVYLKGNNGIETPITINVTVTGDVPSWSVRAQDYEKAMILIGTLNMPGVPDGDSNDLVAAFIDGVCRGVAHPVYNKRYDSYFVTMDIYGGNGDAGKDVTFRAYDASTGTIYPIVETTQAVSYADLSLIGRYENPIILKAVDKIEQTTDLKKGWNWLSIFVKPDAMSAITVFKDLAQDVEMVKAQSQDEGFVINDNGNWFGSLKNLSNTNMYLIKMSQDRTLSVIGQRISPETLKVSVVRGWNWVGYYGNQVISVTDALAGMNPKNGDIIKGQNGVAYYDNFEWIGSLKSLEPGQGYMIMSTVDGERQFSYPQAATTAHRAPMRFSTSNAPTTFVPVDYHNFSGNMTLVAQIIFEDQPAANAEIGIFADSECRQAQVADENGFVYMTIPGDSQTELTVKVAINGMVYDATPSLDYSENAICGTPSAPIIFTVSTTGISSITLDEAETIYDLMGRKLEFETGNGITIKNGKKIMK